MSLFFNINFTIYDNDFEIYIPSFWNHNNTLHIRFYNISTGPIGLHRMKNVFMHIFLFDDPFFLFFFVWILRHRIFETGVFQINFRTGHVFSSVMKSIMVNWVCRISILGSPSSWYVDQGCGVWTFYQVRWISFLPISKLSQINLKYWEKISKH